VPNECPLVDCSRQPDQPHKMHGCRVVSLFWVRPSNHEQRNGEQKGKEQRKLECTFRSDDMVPGRVLFCTPEGFYQMIYTMGNRISPSNLVHLSASVVPK